MAQWSVRQIPVKHIVYAIAAAVTLAIIAFAVWVVRLDHNIKSRFAEKRFAPPVEFYSAPETVQRGLVFEDGHFKNIFEHKNFRAREFGQPLQPGDYSLWTGEQCLSVTGASTAPTPDPATATEPSAQTAAPAPVTPAQCIAFRNPLASGATDDVQIIALDATGRVLDVFLGVRPLSTDRIEIAPELFAQYYGDQPVLRKVVALGETPPLCLNALLAIEDSQFLEHTGVSFTGLLRAFVANLRHGRVAQGGSTITQQLVKNFFLSDERTLKRKLTEIVMAFMVERHATKDEILETYINLIYMGQNGPFQVRGFAAAADHYFSRPLADLNLEDCALTAAIVNSPGLFNPFKHPENATKRRARVLDRMAELNMITAAEATNAKARPLPSRPERTLTEPAPYFVQAVRRELSKQGLDESEGLRVYTTLDIRAQEAAQQAVRTGLERLEKNYANIKKLKESGKSLEAVLLSSDPKTGYVQALVGGRGFQATQFNRATDSRRQVGSVMKPFVYLTALENTTESGEPYTPLTLLNDKPVTHKYEGQTWTPHNYDGAYRGEIPLFFALKESLNASTAELGIKVGLSNIIENAHRMGVASEIKPFPALSLGAFELSPMEVLQAYSTLARLGDKTRLSMLRRVDDLGGNELFLYTPEPETVVNREATAELVGIMKLVLTQGTGRGARALGFTHPAAGKTGTTNDKKDAWFAGFTPYHTAIVWVGYDDNTSHNLTGGSGAVPIWAQYMKDFATRYPADDFQWPESVERAVVPPERQLALGIPNKGEALPEPVELIFRRGQVPEGLAHPAGAEPSPTPNPFKPSGL